MRIDGITYPVLAQNPRFYLTKTVDERPKDVDSVTCRKNYAEIAAKESFFEFPDVTADEDISHFVEHILYRRYNEHSALKHQLYSWAKTAYSLQSEKSHSTGSLINITA